MRCTFHIGRRVQRLDVQREVVRGGHRAGMIVASTCHWSEDPRLHLQQSARTRPRAPHHGSVVKSRGDAELASVGVYRAQDPAGPGYGHRRCNRRRPDRGRLLSDV